MRVVIGAAVCTAAYAVMLALGDREPFRERFGALVLGFWVVCLAMLWWVRRGEFRWHRPVLVVMLAAALVQLPGVLVDPRTSSDAYRYVWDGRVQLSGTSPYRYAPLDDRLAALRDPVLFPGLTSSDRSGFATQPLPSERSALLARAQDDPRTRINRPQVPTIYPPAAQAWFTTVAAVTPWSAGTRGLQVATAGLAVLLAGGLAQLLRRRGADPGGALWWAWCPTVILEAGNGAHVDVVAAALVVGGVWVFSSVRGQRRLWVSGAVLGLAASVKLTPLVLLPAFAPLGMPTWPSPAARVREQLSHVAAALRTPALAVITLAGSYLPHAIVAGWLVVGYLPGYLAEEGGERRGAVLGLVLPDAWLLPGMVLVIAATALWAMRRAADGGDSCNPGDTAFLALVLFGMLLLTTTPSYPWYAVPLVALAVLADRLEWLAVAAAGYLAYGSPTSPPIGGIAYAVAGVVVVGAGLRRAGRLPRGRQPTPVGYRTGE